MYFGEAFSQLRFGNKLRMYRPGWNGKNQFAFHVRGVDTPLTHPALDSPLEVEEHLVLKTTNDKLSGWLPSNADLFADDWMVD